MRTLKTQALSAAAFAPYGAVLGGSVSSGVFINAGTSEKIALPDPELSQAGGQASLNLYRAKANPLPFVARELERHVLGSQSFIPLAGVPFVVVVALGDPAFQGRLPLESSLAAFWLDGSCGVSFNWALGITRCWRNKWVILLCLSAKRQRWIAKLNRCWNLCKFRRARRRHKS